jgi:hypothetical protein
MTAKEMFEIEKVKFINETDRYIVYNDGGVIISFDKKYKTICFTKEIDTYRSTTDYDADFMVIVAITQQMKELGWIE